MGLKLLKHPQPVLTFRNDCWNLMQRKGDPNSSPLLACRQPGATDVLDSRFVLWLGDGSPSCSDKAYALSAYTVVRHISFDRIDLVEVA